jgi:ribonuclease J
MLRRHAQIAVDMGMPVDNAVILEMGQALELSEDEANITGPIPTGSVMVDGLGVGDVGNVVLRDRKHLSQDGLIIVVVGVSKETGHLTSGPELISRGFVYVRENEELIAGARNVAMNVLSRYDTIAQSDWTAIKNGIKDEMHDYLYGLIKRNPMILPIIMET